MPLNAFQLPQASASALYRASREAETAGDSLKAYLFSLKAASIDPSNQEFALRKELLQNRVLQTAGTSVITPTDPDRMAFRLATEGLSPSDLIDSQAALPPTRLKGSADRKSFDLRGAARSVFEQVGEAYGIHIIFEPDYQAPQINFRVSDLTMAEAFRALETITNSFLVPVRDTEAEVFRDTTQNRTTYVPVMSLAIPIPDRMNIQDAQDMATGVQQTMEIRRIAVDAGRRVIYMRDQESKVRAAQQILHMLARNRAQVELEVELLSISSNAERHYGLALPTSFQLVNFSSFLHNVPAAIANIAGFATFGGGTTFLGLGIANATAFATMSKLTSESVFQTQVTGLDGQQLTVHIGDRYPVVTGRLGNANGTTANTPQIAYQDLGLKIQVTPAVHNGEISLIVEGEYDQLGAVQSNGIPIISTRKFQGTARLQDGEWAVFSGLTINNTLNEISGIPGLSQIPWVGRIFRENHDTQDSGEILVVLKPRLLSLPAWEDPAGPMYVGSETKPLTLY